MNFPYLQSAQKTRSLVEAFRGINQNVVIPQDEFSSMKNMSCYDYPAITTRRPRGPVDFTTENLHGLFWKNGLFYISGSECYYNGELIPGMVVSDEDNKQIVGMGAYIVVFPDKLSYNTATGMIQPLEVTFAPEGDIVFEPLSQNSTYTRINCQYIGDYFSAYDNVTISGCTEDQYNATKIIMEIGLNYIVVAGVLEEAFTQSGGITFRRTCPDMDFVCEQENRLWGCSSANHEIYASKLGDPNNWNNFEGIASDAYALTVGSDGDFTGCIAHLGYVMFFKENNIHTMYGNKPANYSLYTKELPGVRKGCSRSLVVVGDTLYYVGLDGVYAFNGSSPVKISWNITQEITDAVAGRHDGKYYLSCKLDGEQALLVYDPLRNIWDAEDETEFVYVARGETALYYSDRNGSVRNVTGDTAEHIEWNIASGDMMEGILEHKYMSRLLLHFDLDAGAHANIWVRYDDSPVWERKATIQCDQRRTFAIPIKPKRCTRFRWKMDGYGGMRLIGMQITVEGGSELNGSIRSGLRR